MIRYSSDIINRVLNLEERIAKAKELNDAIKAKAKDYSQLDLFHWAEDKQRLTIPSELKAPYKKFVREMGRTEAIRLIRQLIAKLEK